MWSSEIELKYEMVEIFAGQGRASKQFQAANKNVGMFDSDYDSRAMNIMNSAGLAHPGCIKQSGSCCCVETRTFR